MNIIISGLLLFSTFIVYGQSSYIQVFSNQKAFGKNFADSSVINATEYVFPNRIHEMFFDSTTNFLTVQTREFRKNGIHLFDAGDIIQYDIQNKKVLWSRDIDYVTNNLQQYNKTMMYTIGVRSYCIDVYTGNELWEVKNNIYYVDPINNIGIGYKYKTFSGYTNELQGINLKDGKILWERELNREYGWNNLFYTNDSTMIVVAAGLHAINMRTGKGWDYNTITGKKDYKGTAAANIAGVALGIFTGMFMLSTGHDLVRDLVSNTVVDSSSIYFASSERLAKIDKESGEILWESSFQKDIAGKSTIFVNDSVVFMVNKGIAFMGDRQLYFGKPFIAAFNRQSGEKTFLSIIDVKADPILSFEIHHKEIYLIFKNRIAKYSMETGAQILQKEFPKDNFGELKYFVGGQVFVSSHNEELVNLRQSDSTKLYVFTNQGKTLSLDHDLNVTNTIHYDDLSIYYEKTPDFKFFSKDKNTLVVNNEGKKIAEIDASTKAFIIGNTLYEVQDKSFIAVDLSKLKKEQDSNMNH